MALPFEDLDAFFDLDVHAQKVLVGEEFQEIAIAAIYDSFFYESNDGRAPISTSSPTVTCKDCDIADLGIEQGTRMVVAEVAYEVRTVEPDGTGTSIVTLSIFRPRP